jgi:hypothetical protein
MSEQSRFNKFEEDRDGEHKFTNSVQLKNVNIKDRPPTRTPEELHDIKTRKENYLRQLVGGECDCIVVMPHSSHTYQHELKKGKEVDQIHAGLTPSFLSSLNANIALQLAQAASLPIITLADNAGGKTMYGANFTTGDSIKRNLEKNRETIKEHGVKILDELIWSNQLHGQLQLLIKYFKEKELENVVVVTPDYMRERIEISLRKLGIKPGGMLKFVYAGEVAEQINNIRNGADSLAATNFTQFNSELDKMLIKGDRSKQLVHKWANPLGIVSGAAAAFGHMLHGPRAHRVVFTRFEESPRTIFMREESSYPKDDVSKSVGLSTFFNRIFTGNNR